MTLYQCTKCGAVQKPDSQIGRCRLYAGGCDDGCGFVYLCRIGIIDSIRYRLYGYEPPLWKQKRRTNNAHDPLYGWNK